MGILKDPKSQETPVSAKRRSLQTDFSSIGPLKPGGTVGFLNFRDKSENKDKKKKNKSVEDDDMESEDDDDDSILGKADDEEAKEDNHDLTAEDIKRQGELAEGVRKIKVSRAGQLGILYANRCSLNVNTLLQA
jgi:predicted  nucleic acid-binding Zn-ribbon protein